MLALTKDFKEIGIVQWKLFLCLVLACAVVFACMCNNVISAGKVCSEFPTRVNTQVRTRTCTHTHTHTLTRIKSTYSSLVNRKLNKDYMTNQIQHSVCDAPTVQVIWMNGDTVASNSSCLHLVASYIYWSPSFYPPC